MGGKKKKAALIFCFCLCSLIITRFLIRFIDATVQIDEDYLLLLLSVLAVNGALVFLYRWIYRKLSHRLR